MQNLKPKKERKEKRGGRGGGGGMLGYVHVLARRQPVVSRGGTRFTQCPLQSAVTCKKAPVCSG